MIVNRSSIGRVVQGRERLQTNHAATVRPLAQALTKPPVDGQLSPASVLARDHADIDRESRSFYVDGLCVEETMTLQLHGELSDDSVPHLQAVLDGLELLRPSRLVIDLSDVSRVSREALTMMLRCAPAIGGPWLRAPSLEARVEIARLGRSALIDPELARR